MQFFFDTEFDDDGRSLQLISIGIVREDGAEFYAEAAEYDRETANPWLQANVIPLLNGPIMPQKMLAANVYKFCGHKPEFWACYAAHDWVAMCNLFGGMLKLPATWPHFCRDLKQYEDICGVSSTLRQTTPQHHALNDAHHLRNMYRHISGKHIQGL